MLISIDTPPKRRMPTSTQKLKPILMKKLIVLVLGIGFFISPLYKKVVHASTIIPRTIFNLDNHPAESKIQIALLLDTSNSMDGLIDQAKSQLWKMVNELASAERNGHVPQIELALYHYGNSNLSGETYFIERKAGLTKDLDLVSEKLFSLSTNGGNEYCGAVIKTSLKELDWSNSPKDLKLMIIAGNEPFDQGPVDFRNFCSEAKSSGIQINTIFCGDYNTGKSIGWMEGANIAEGKYLNIDQDQKVIHINTPYDRQIIDLNIRLNKTYIGYGHLGKEKMSLQNSQDINANSYGAANMRSRAAVKAKKSYNNASWDLVDAVEENESILDDSVQMPPMMQSMNKEERADYIKLKKSERDQIQKEILALEKKARAFEEKERAKMEGSEKTLDNVLIEAVKSQAVKKKFEFQK